MTTTPEIVIDLEPNWSEPVDVVYGFDTVVAASPSFNEQRRWLHPNPVRSISCKYSGDGAEAQRMGHVLKCGLSKVCCVPVYSEPISAEADPSFPTLQGSTQIPAVGDLTHLWNIQNCSWVVLIDFVSGQSEMVAVSEISGQFIVLASAIINSWNPDSLIVYPAIAALITGMRALVHTSVLAEYFVEFGEIEESEEAEGVAE